jgi:hypothetical protein
MKSTTVLLTFALFIVVSPAFADKVITKDGKTYTGKILIDSDKAVLIGNPPFDPNSTLIQGEDIKTIIYEEYKPNAPAVRRRGITSDFRLSGNYFTSDELKLNPAAGLRLAGGFRFHPIIELEGGFDWLPSLTAKNGLAIVADTGAGLVSRRYESFGMYVFEIEAKLYPFGLKPSWKTEPYVHGGYGWSRLVPKASGDSLKGDGWLLGFGALRPLTKNLFLDVRFDYKSWSYDRVKFLGQEGAISPAIAEHQLGVSAGLSYRI